MSAKATFVIQEGIRRAKAHQLEGLAEIEANVFNLDGAFVETRMIPLEALRSTKDSIDISDSGKWERLDRLRRAIREGRILPAIGVVPGSIGIPLVDVPLDTLGEDR